MFNSTGGISNETTYFTFLAGTLINKEKETPKEELIEKGYEDTDKGLYTAQQVETTRRILEDKYPKDLSTLLFNGMAEIHKKAKKNQFLNDLIKNQFCAKAYVIYLCNLFVLHEAIEKAQNEIVSKYGKECFIFPILFRSKRLLNDIKMWSMFTTLAPKFADEDNSTEEFANNVRSLVEKCTLESVKHIEATCQEDPAYVIGTIYALYGTLMAGGQVVKKGVFEGFVFRIVSDDIEEDEEKVLLKEYYQDRIKENKECLGTYAEHSVSFFSVSEEVNFSMSQFKQERRQSLNNVLKLLKLEEIQRKIFEKRLVSEVEFAVKSVLNFIDSMLETLKNEKY